MRAFSVAVGRDQGWVMKRLMRLQGVLRYGWVLAAAALLLLVALLPIEGWVIVAPRESALPWPQFTLDPPAPRPGDLVRVTVTDVTPWAFVQLTVQDRPADALGTDQRAGGLWAWSWLFTAPEAESYALTFYRDCHLGCVERGRVVLGSPATTASSPAGLPTKLGLVFPSLERDWHGRAGWAVEVTYAHQAEAAYWGVDDLATRVAAHRAQGLRVLVRVDYDQQQSLPPTGDYIALSEYLEYVRRLARDVRLQDVVGIIVGADYNAAEANALASEQPVTPEWYARLFSGYGEPVAHSDNVVQAVRAVNPNLRVLVGPLRPWVFDQDGIQRTEADVPWLNYMNTLVALLDETARAKSAAGIPLAAPDGFDVQAPGRPDAPEMVGRERASEPRQDLPRAAWGGAQVGFRVYQDWLAVINAYPTTQGLPVYIISTNTFDREAKIPPAQNYPRGWLTTAAQVIAGEPQIVALCWFMDEFPHGDEWDWFSLTERPGRLVDAAEEFDNLLREE